MKPILMNRNVARSTFKIRLPENTKADDVVIRITRKGDTSGWEVVYPALSVENDEVVFAWDEVLWNAKSGRYQGRILVNGVSGCQMCVAFHIGCPCSMGQSVNDYFTHGDCLGCCGHG